MMMIVINVSYGNYVRLTSRGVLLTPEAGGFHSFSEQVFLGSSLALAPSHLIRSTAI